MNHEVKFDEKQPRSRSHNHIGDPQFFLGDTVDGWKEIPFPTTWDGAKTL